MCGGCWNGVWKRTRRSGCATSAIWSCCWRRRANAAGCSGRGVAQALPWIAAAVCSSSSLGVPLGAVARDAAGGASAGAAGCRSGRGCFVARPQPIDAGSSVAISPDGTRLVYASGTPRSCSPGASINPKPPSSRERRGHIAPFFSPDGQWIGFQTGRQAEQDLRGRRRGGPAGGLRQLRRRELGRGWQHLRERCGGKGLVRIRDGGGAPETVAALGNGEVALTFPQILPGGKAILFSAYTALNPDAASIEVMTLADRHRKTVSRGGTSPRYLATSNGTGHLVYLNKATLFAIPFDLDKLETRGTALPILDDVASNSLLGTAQVSFSRSGTLVYRRGGGDAGLVTVAWLDSAGKTQPLLAKPGAYWNLRLSPDGQRLAMEVTEGSGTDIWIYDWQRDTMTRLTFDGKAPGSRMDPGRTVHRVRVGGSRHVRDPVRRSRQGADIDPEQKPPVSVVLHGGRKADGVHGAGFEDHI